MKATSKHLYEDYLNEILDEEIGMTRIEFIMDVWRAYDDELWEGHSKEREIEIAWEDHEGCDCCPCCDCTCD